MGLKTTGMGSLKATLSRIGQAVPRAMDQELAMVAAEVRNKAKAMAPIDYGDLKSAIRLRRLGVQGAGGRFVAGLSNYEVYLDMNQPVTDPDKEETRVGEYAWKVHEHMGWAGNRRALMPSEKSVAAGKAEGVDAGGRFMERALLEVVMAENITARLARVARKQLR